MTNIEAARILSEILKKQQELPPKHRDLDNREMLAMGKAVKVLRLESMRKKHEREGGT